MVSAVGVTPKQARGLKDNLLVSSVGLCIPGIIYNLEKMGQIQCRYIYCLENEVPAGIPVDVCETLKSQMWCKYGFGEAMNFIPYLSVFDVVLQTIKTFIQDPVGSAMSIAWNICAIKCPVSSAGAGTCSAVTITLFIFEQWMNIENALSEKKTIDKDYCSLIED